MLASHLWNGTKRAKAIASFGDLEIGEMFGSDLKSIGIRKGSDRSRSENGSLFFQSTDKPISDPGDLFTTKDTYQPIDIRAAFEQLFTLTFGQTARNDDATNLALLLEVEHLVDRSHRLLASAIDESTRVDDHEVALFGFADQLVPVELQQSKHAFTIHQILGTAQADEGVTSLALAFRLGCG